MAADKTEKEAKEERKSSKTNKKVEVREPSQIVIHDTRGQIWMDDREMA